MTPISKQVNLGLYNSVLIFMIIFLTSILFLHFIKLVAIKCIPSFLKEFHMAEYHNIHSILRQNYIGRH